MHQWRHSCDRCGPDAGGLRTIRGRHQRRPQLLNILTDASLCPFRVQNRPAPLSPFAVQIASELNQHADRARSYQNWLPGTPLNGPARSLVIHPP